MHDDVISRPAFGRPSLRITPAILAIVALLGCSSSGDSSSSATQTDAQEPATEDTEGSASDVLAGDAASSGDAEDDMADVTPIDVPPRVCRSGSMWAPGTQAFVDVSESAGLRALSVNGMILSSADLDGDGFPEIVVRDYAPGVRDEFTADGPRRTFLLHNDSGFKFSDETQSSGLTATRDGGQGRTTMIVVYGDIDNDGDLDAFAGLNSSDATKDNGDRSEILINDGTGQFTLGDGGALRQEGLNVPTTSASFIDFDRDGFLDLWVGYDVVGQTVRADALYKGDGKGGFVEWSASMGVETVDWTSLSVLNEGRGHRRSWGVTACDVNDDGFPDLISSSYGRYFNGLWLSDGQGSYLDTATTSGVGADPRVDWSTNFNAQCYCELVPNAADCAGVPPSPDYFPCTSTNNLRWDHDQDREPFRLGGNTFTTACGDLDSDGDMDLVNFEIVHWDVGDTSDPTEVLYNDGSGVFTRPGGEATGVQRTWDMLDWNAGDMTGGIFDFDNDGRPDIYVGSSDYPGTRGVLFHQDSTGRFVEVPFLEGIDHPRSHGFTVADFDLDGDLDVAVGHSRGRCSGDPSCLPSKEVHVYENVLGQNGNFLQIRLVGGPGTNRAAIGARVKVTAGGVTQTQEVGGGYGHYGLQNDTLLHFGLGDACDVESVEVRWPNATGATQVFEDVRGNYRITLTQGSSDVEYRFLKGAQ